MKKIFISLFLILSLFISKPVFAQEATLTITCNSGSECTKSSDFSFFSETNIYPGFTHTQNFSVRNNRKAPCQLTFKAVSQEIEQNSLSRKILINISGNDSETKKIYQSATYLLSDLLNSSKLASLGHINTGATNKYLWSTTFDPEADDEYQDLSTNFNIDFNFQCDDESTDNPSNNSSNPPSNQGTAQCTNKSAPTAPTHLVATRQSDGDIGLSWTETTSEHTGYLLAFGTSPGNYQYGSPNIGDGSSYTVQGLTPNAQYCFYVRSLNDCMPGERTPEYCVNPGSNIPAAVPTIYQQNVLGDTTQVDLTETSDKNVLGSQDSSCSKHWLPILFIVALLINLVYVRLPTKDKLVPIIISLATYLLDRYLLQSRCCFGPSWLCNYFWIGNILSWLIPVFVFKQKKK